MYEILVGEIGIPPDKFHDLAWWEIRSIIRGHNRRHRDLWSASRWSTYNIMLSFCGSDALKKSGINGPADLIKLPWDTVQKEEISQHDIDELQAEMAAMNANQK